MLNSVFLALLARSQALEALHRLQELRSRAEPRLSTASSSSGSARGDKRSFSQNQVWRIRVRRPTRRTRHPCMVVQSMRALPRRLQGAGSARGLASPCNPWMQTRCRRSATPQSQRCAPSPSLCKLMHVSMRGTHVTLFT